MERGRHALGGIKTLEEKCTEKQGCSCKCIHRVASVGTAGELYK